MKIHIPCLSDVCPLKPSCSTWHKSAMLLIAAWLCNSSPLVHQWCVHLIWLQNRDTILWCYHDQKRTGGQTNRKLTVVVVKACTTVLCYVPKIRITNANIRPVGIAAFCSTQITFVRANTLIIIYYRGTRCGENKKRNTNRPISRNFEIRICLTKSGFAWRWPSNIGLPENEVPVCNS